MRVTVAPDGAAATAVRSPVDSTISAAISSGARAAGRQLISCGCWTDGYEEEDEETDDDDDEEEDDED